MFKTTTTTTTTITITLGLVGLLLNGQLLAAQALDSLIEPGTLLSVETKNGKTIEKYSDGLIAEIDHDGNRKETRTKDNFSMEGLVPDAYKKDQRDEAVEGFISTLIDIADLRGPNTSQAQSRLRQFSAYYLKMKDPSKAEPLAQKYLHIQQVLRTAEPLAYAQRNLGEIDIALGKFTEAIPLLQAAAAYYKSSPDRLSYCNALNDCGYALLRAGRPDACRMPLEECLLVAKENSFSELKKKAKENLRQASKTMKHK
jgi:tetratricopeptide (TPR) repeat protein